MTDLKKIFIITIISCFLSVINISYRIFEEYQKENAKEETMTLIREKNWDVLLIKRDDPKSLQEISGFLDKMNITREDQVIFGFMAKKDPNKRWDESLVEKRD